MKSIKIINVSIPILLLIVSGFVFVNCNNKNETAKKSSRKPLSAIEKLAIIKKWESSSSGRIFKKWEASPAGKKVYANEAKIRKSITDFSNMDGLVTSLSLPPGSIWVTPDTWENNTFGKL